MSNIALPVEDPKYESRSCQLRAGTEPQLHQEESNQAGVVSMEAGTEPQLHPEESRDQRDGGLHGDGLSLIHI